MNVDAYIRRNQKKFLTAIKILARIKNLSKRATLFHKLSFILYRHATDIYYIPELEHTFIELANKISTKLPETFIPQSTLHVLTTSYLTGGHTRCAERWIALSPKTEIHSCLIIKQHGPIPQRLFEVCSDHDGKVIILDRNLSLTEAAKQLRINASNYSKIILYTHPNDPTPIVAFATPQFLRPVIYFNHADHIFWLGRSISDVVAEINSSGKRLSEEYRCAHSYLLGIPPDTTAKTTPIQQEITSLLPKDKKIIFSSGDNSKFLPIGESNFSVIIETIFSIEQDICFVILGANKKNSFWKQLKARYKNNLLLLESLPYDKYISCLQKADIVIDSFPIGGGTAIIDAINYNIPVLSFKPLHQSDFVMDSECNCATLSDLRNKTINVLTSESYRKTFSEKLKSSYETTQGVSSWLIRKDQLISSLPTHHSIKILSKAYFSECPKEHTKRFLLWIEPGAGNLSYRIIDLIRWCRFIFTCIIVYLKKEKHNNFSN